MLVHYHRGEERAEAVAAEIGGAPTAQADLTQEADVDAAVRDRARAARLGRRVRGGRRRLARGGRARLGAPARALGGDARQNLTATFLTARAFLREVARNGHGSLVLVGSTAGRFGEAGHADYAAAKSAIQTGLLLSLKNEVARVAPRARVNAVAPGWTESPMTRGHVDPAAVAAISRTMAAAQGRPARGRRGTGRRARLRHALRPCQRPGRHGRRRNGGPRRPRGLTRTDEKGGESLAAPSLFLGRRKICRQSPTRSTERSARQPKP